MAPRELTGQTFGRLTAVERAPNMGRHVVWLFSCECGGRKVIKADSVTRGMTSSCGCLRREVTKARSETHGHATGRVSSPELRARDHAKARCNNPNDAKYPHYGGRGIRMCDTWEHDFSAFYADMGPRPPGTTLDRIDVDGDYEPGNCRWATLTEQARNRRVTLRVDFEGKTIPLVEYAKRQGVSYKALWGMLRRGKSLHDATTALT